MLYCQPHPACRAYTRSGNERALRSSARTCSAHPQLLLSLQSSARLRRICLGLRPAVALLTRSHSSASLPCPVLRSQPSHKTFKIKKILAKKQRQNRPIPQWIRLRTDNTVKSAHHPTTHTAPTHRHSIVAPSLPIHSPCLLSSAPRARCVVSGITPRGVTGGGRSWASKRRGGDRGRRERCHRRHLYRRSDHSAPVLSSPRRASAHPRHHVTPSRTTRPRPACVTAVAVDGADGGSGVAQFRGCAVAL